MLFDWDESNINHIALHGVTPEEAEQVLQNDPFDLTYHKVYGEDRWGQIGQTNGGRVLYIVTTPRGTKIRVVTCFRPTRTQVVEYLQDRRKYYE